MNCCSAREQAGKLILALAPASPVADAIGDLRFHQQHPQVKVRIMEGQLLAMINAAAPGELDFTINTYYPGRSDHEFSFEKLFRNRSRCSPRGPSGGAGHLAGGIDRSPLDHADAARRLLKRLQECFEQLDGAGGGDRQTFSSCIAWW